MEAQDSPLIAVENSTNKFDVLAENVGAEVESDDDVAPSLIKASQSAFPTIPAGKSWAEEVEDVMGKFPFKMLHLFRSLANHFNHSF